MERGGASGRERTLVCVWPACGRVSWERDSFAQTLPTARRGDASFCAGKAFKESATTKNAPTSVLTQDQELHIHTVVTQGWACLGDASRAATELQAAARRRVQVRGSTARPSASPRCDTACSP